MGSLSFTSDKNWEYPIIANVTNRGQRQAGIFKLAAFYTDSKGGRHAVAFTVKGESSAWYPYTDKPLGAGNLISFQGTVTFPGSLTGSKGDLTVEADSCSGDEFMPKYCRVQESNEGNNISNRLPLSLIQPGPG